MIFEVFLEKIVSLKIEIAYLFLKKGKKVRIISFKISKKFSKKEKYR